MLTAEQTEVVAYFANGDTYCPACYNDEFGLDLRGASGSWPQTDSICRYSAEEEYSEGGLYCDKCGKEIVAPELDEDEDEADE